ncbi:unnamed protein product [Caenorhabditis nigoni]
MDGSEASVEVLNSANREGLNMARTENISQLDDLVKEVLFSHTDWRSMLALRNTCDSFRRFIDEKHPMFDLSEVEIDLCDTHVQIVCKTHSKKIDRVKFTKHENGCLVVEQERISLLNELETTLKARKTKLKVNWLSLKTKKKDYHRILSLVASASLKRIELDFLDEESVEQRIPEQWKSAEELISTGFLTRFQTPIDDFLHFSRLEAHFSEIYLHDLRKMKDAYLKAPNFQEAFIRYENIRLTGMDVLADNVRPTGDSQHWFQTSYSPNRCLFVLVSERIARFVNAPIGSAPEGAFETNQEFPEPGL